MENNKFQNVCVKNRTGSYFDDIRLTLRIRFEEIHRFIRIYDGGRYLVLLSPEIHNAIYNRIRYLISFKSVITYIISYFAEIKVDFYCSLSIEKILTLHNVILLIKSVLNKDQNHYYYKIRIN